MPLDDSRKQRSPPEMCRFATTHWSMVLAASGPTSPAAQQALATLCEWYWYPLYAHVRRRGHSADEAQDLIQEFFARLLDKDYLEHADRQRGRFRSFLLAALDHFLANEWRREHAQKRGGGQVVLALDFQAGEDRYHAEPSHDLTAEKLYERRWALTLIDRAQAQLRQEFVQAGKLEQFERLKPYLGGGEDTVPYRDLGRVLRLSEGAVKVSVHRLRRRCRELLRAELAQTVAGPEEVEDELRSLFAAVSL